MGDGDARLPAGGASTGRRVDRLGLQAGAGDYPGHDRVRVPHLASAELVTAPRRSGHGCHQIEHAPCTVDLRAQPEWAVDRLGDVGDDAVAPAANLVLK